MFSSRNPRRVFANGCPRIIDIRPISRIRWAPKVCASTAARQAVVRVKTLQRFNGSTLQPRNAFTLLELLIVMGIIAILMVLIAPAFTTIKGGSDVTSAAYTIKGVLDTARTYAKANNTYTWVGFLEENVANPVSPNSDTPAVGRLVMSIVASKDGTTVYDPNNLATLDQDRQPSLMDTYRYPKRHGLNICDPAKCGLYVLHRGLEPREFRDAISVSCGQPCTFCAVHVQKSSPNQP
jgi:prepilin-type N-terminal cleavage/methylation domain-containing protein